MIEMTINKENYEQSFYISKYNNIIIRNPKQVLEFYQVFDEVLNDKEVTIKIAIGNQNITTKNYVLVNLLDIEAIINQFKYKKGSLIYEYVNIILENVDINIVDEINDFLEQKFNKIANEFNFNYYLSLETDLIKLFNNQVEFKPLINVSEYDSIVEYLIKFIAKTNLNKKIIIFINSNLLKINFNDCDNLFVFDFSNSKDVTEYNLIITDEITNFDYNILLNQIKINWPTNYVDQEIFNSLNFYMKYFYSKDKIKTNDVNIIIISKIINKFYDFNQLLEYDTKIINNVIKSFLDNF